MSLLTLYATISINIRWAGIYNDRYKSCKLNTIFQKIKCKCFLCVNLVAFKIDCESKNSKAMQLKQILTTVFD